jgi:FixJ family two-component response regulator
MEAFAARAAVELEATGEHARTRTVDTRDQLTPQEAEISRLVARGDSNREISAAVHQPEHGRVPPPQGVSEARREVAHAACSPDVVVRLSAGEREVGDAAR